MYFENSVPETLFTETFFYVQMVNFSVYLLSALIIAQVYFAYRNSNKLGAKQCAISKHKFS